MDTRCIRTSCTYVLEGFVQLRQPAHTPLTYLVYLVWYHCLVIWFLLQVLLDRLRGSVSEGSAGNNNAGQAQRA